MRYFAEIGPGNIVLRVIVAENEDYPQSLGGVWVETFQDDPIAKYASKGMVYDSSTPDKFSPQVSA